MTLRARITMIVVVSFVAMAAAIVGGSLILEQSLRAQYSVAVLNGDLNTWSGILDNNLQRLKPQVELLASRDEVIRAVGTRDKEQLAGILTAELERFSEIFDARTVPQVEVMTNQGIMLFGIHAHPTVAGTVLTLEITRLAGGQGTSRGGLARRTDGGYAVAVLAPVYTREGLTAFLVLWQPLEPLIERLSRTLSAGVDVIPQPLATSPEEPSAELIGASDGRQLLEAEFPLIDLVGRSIGSLRTSRDVTDEQRRLDIVRMLSYGAVGCGLLLLAGFLQWYMRQAFAPLIGVIRVLNALARGNQQVRFEVPKRRDEIGRLAETVSAFRENLVELELARTAKQRIESELAVAREIQLNIVPDGAAEFPDHTELRLHALMEPARAVGGDLYDFFLLDQDHLFFVIGDVSDKGFPSALFMAIVRTVIKAKMETSDLSLERLMTSVNQYLCQNNPSEMFVTIFAGTLDLRTGTIEYCDGGHEPPLIWHHDGRVEAIEKVGGLALGWADDFRYRAAQVQLAPGDMLVLFTDGVTEATNEHEGMFSSDRVLDLLGGLGEASQPEVATRRILNEVRAFSGPMPQSDDITILALQYRGGRRETIMATAAE